MTMILTTKPSATPYPADKFFKVAHNSLLSKSNKNNNDDDHDDDHNNNNNYNNNNNMLSDLA